MKTLAQIAYEKPYPEYQAWWPMGRIFSALMQEAILTSWKEIVGIDRDLSQPENYASEFIRTVYARIPSPTLVKRFAAQDFDNPIASGEFDALSYAFFRSAFEHLRAQNKGGGMRRFTQIVGRRFFDSLAGHLQLELPSGLHDSAELAALKFAINKVGNFLVEQGYLRDRFDFSFTVTLSNAGSPIQQKENEIIRLLMAGKTAFAVYRMGYPAILPSAVYLYHTLGEAQHHSSRTIEELFARAGCEARETNDFDPTGFPADEVVELWEIRRS